MNRNDFQTAFRLLSQVDQLLCVEHLVHIVTESEIGDFYYGGWTIDSVTALYQATDDHRALAMSRTADHQWPIA